MHKTYRFAIRIMMILFFFSHHSSILFSQSDADIQEDALYQFIEDYYTTLSDRDWPAFKNFFCEDGTLTTIWQEPNDTIPRIHVNAIDSFILKAKDGPDSQPIFEENMLDADLEIKNNLAQAWVRYEVKFGTEDNLYEWKGMDLFSFIRHNGEWKIVSIVFEAE